VRKFLIFFGLWLGLSAGVFAAETLTLTDGTSVSGEVEKADDIGVMVHTSADTYPTIQWTQFSQDSLKQLAANPKLKPYVDPFIEPTAADRPPKPEIKAPTVTRILLPPAQLHPALLGGLWHSSLGLFILLVLYAANLYAAYEVAIVRGKSLPMALALSAVLPLVGPIVFLVQPIRSRQEETAEPEESSMGAPAHSAGGAPAGAGSAPASAGTSQPAPGAGQEDIQIVSASWQPGQEEKKPQPQVFARGKFTMNKRFIETKFAGFIGEPKGIAKTFTMELKTLKATLLVECIKQLAANEMILETSLGQTTVGYADIQEIKLIPKPA
jgi:hypothetical protein